jgi:hypothetical protein
MALTGYSRYAPLATVRKYLKEVTMNRPGPASNSEQFKDDQHASIFDEMCCVTDSAEYDDCDGGCDDGNIDNY